jgi:hypothetical protein
MKGRLKTGPASFGGLSSGGRFETAMRTAFSSFRRLPKLFFLSLSQN